MSRQGHPTVAHRFNGGRASRTIVKSRQGRQNLAITVVTSGRRLATLGVSVAPAGAAGRERLVDPPMNRWAMIGSPCRDKEESQRRRRLFACRYLLSVTPWRPWPVGFRAECLNSRCKSHRCTGDREVVQDQVPSPSPRSFSPQSHPLPTPYRQWGEGGRGTPLSTIRMLTRRALENVSREDWSNGSRPLPPRAG